MAGNRIAEGATNQTAFEVLRKHFNKALKGPGWNALLEAIATGDEYLGELARSIFDQMFLKTASGHFLRVEGKNRGIEPPEGVGIGEDAYRELVATVSNNKLTIDSVYRILEIFFGSSATRAYIESELSGPYALSDGDELIIELDGETTITVTFRESDFFAISEASAFEVASVITRALQLRGTNAFAEQYTDPATGNASVRIFSGRMGLRGSVRVLGGRAQNTLQFYPPLQVKVAGGQWNVVRTSSDRTRFTWTGMGDSPSISLLRSGDYANIYGSIFHEANRGTREVVDVGLTWFEVAADSFAEQLGVVLDEGDILFFRPIKRTIYASGSPAIASQGGDGLDVIVPATSQIVERRLGTGTYLPTPIINKILEASRDADGQMSLTLEDPHALNPGNTVFVDGLRAKPQIVKPYWQPIEVGEPLDWDIVFDMRTNVGSDGRKIITTRATPAQVEVAPGVWIEVPPNVGAYGIHGLESWAQNTSYLSWGAELDRFPTWRESGATLAKQDGFYRITGVNSSSRVYQRPSSPEAGDWTLSCIMRTAASQNARLRIYQEGGSGGGFCNLDSSDEFSTYSCTQTITGTPTQLSIHVYSGIGHIDVQGCWVTKSDTPGRPVWGGEGPVTCDRDFHRIPSTGIPAEKGVIEWTMKLFRTPNGGTSALRGILWEDGAGVPNRISLTDTGRIRLNPGTGAAWHSPVLTWEERRNYNLRVELSPSSWRVYRDGVLVGSTTPTGPFSWGSTARIGDLLDGAISSLRIRSN